MKESSDVGTARAVAGNEFVAPAGTGAGDRWAEAAVVLGQLRTAIRLMDTAWKDAEARASAGQVEIARLRKALKHISDNTHDERSMREADAALQEQP